MDNQQPVNAPITPLTSGGSSQTQQQPPIQPSVPTSMAPISNIPANSKPHIGMIKRIAYFIFGLLLLLFSLSIVQGQATHSWDIVGIVMILVFGIPGLYILYYSVFRVSS
jgi:hypothetical protein